MNTEALISMLHTNQLPYKRIYAGDFIYELAPKNIGFNHKVAVPDAIRELLGEHVSIGITTLSDKDSLWHSLLYAIMPEKYEGYNWHYRKLMVGQLIEAMDDRKGRAFSKNRVLIGTTLKQDAPNLSLTAVSPTPELLFYICLTLNINLAVYRTGMVNRTEYHFPTANYDPSLPLIILHADDKPIFSVISVNEQSIYPGDNFTARQIALMAPKEHYVLRHYAGPRCPPDIYAKITGLSDHEAARREKSIELTKQKLTDLKDYASKLGIKIIGSGRITKQGLIDKILDHVGSAIFDN